MAYDFHSRCRFRIARICHRCKQHIPEGRGRHRHRYNHPGADRKSLLKQRIPRPPNVPLLMAFWSLVDGIWGVLQGSWGVLVCSIYDTCSIYLRMGVDLDRILSARGNTSEARALRMHNSGAVLMHPFLQSKYLDNTILQHATYVYVYIHAYMYVYIYTYINICIYVYMCTSHHLALAQFCVTSRANEVGWKLSHLASEDAEVESK